MSVRKIALGFGAVPVGQQERLLWGSIEHFAPTRRLTPGCMSMFEMMYRGWKMANRDILEGDNWGMKLVLDHTRVWYRCPY